MCEKTGRCCQLDGAGAMQDLWENRVAMGGHVSAIQGCTKNKAKAPPPPVAGR
jgi:hypothetical protein